MHAHNFVQFFSISCIELKMNCSCLLTCSLVWLIAIRLSSGLTVKSSIRADLAFLSQNPVLHTIDKMFGERACKGIKTTERENKQNGFGCLLLLLQQLYIAVADEHGIPWGKWTFSPTSNDRMRGMNVKFLSKVDLNEFQMRLKWHAAICSVCVAIDARNSIEVCAKHRSEFDLRLGAARAHRPSECDMQSPWNAVT